MVNLGNVLPRGKKALLGVFKAVLGVLLHASKPLGRMRAHACGRAGAGACVQVRACVHAHAYTYREDPPHAKKFRPLFLLSNCQVSAPKLFLVFYITPYCMMSQSYVTLSCFLF